MAFGAAQPPFGRLARLGPNTITSIPDLLGELEQVRRNGYATTWEELEAGLCSAAAPVRGARGHGHRRDLGLRTDRPYVPRAARLAGPAT